MDMLDKLTAWLRTYPKWNQEKLTVNFLEGTPGNSGLFPQGCRELSRREDVQGNLRIRCRLTLLLRRAAFRSESGEDARWVLELEQWVQQQCAMGLVPKLGDEPETEIIRGEGSRLLRVNQTGAAVTELQLRAEFTKYYEENEYGKN